MPDGELSPEQQINTEATLDRTAHTLGAALGVNVDAKLGGGTPNGSWVFADLEELDQAILHWTTIEDALARQANSINRARTIVGPPASDIMSISQAQAFKQSLFVLRQHAMDMAAYAKDYVAKLRAARSAYAAAEQNIVARFDGSHG